MSDSTSGFGKAVEYMRLNRAQKAIYRALRNKGYSHAEVIAVLAHTGAAK